MQIYLDANEYNIMVRYTVQICVRHVCMCSLADQCPSGDLIDTPGTGLFNIPGLRLGYHRAAAPDGSMLGYGYHITRLPLSHDDPSDRPMGKVYRLRVRLY